MDVHAPHHPISGWKDFFVHLITITVGLLIAVGIEGLVERHREHVLVREARETLRREVEHNNAIMKDTLGTLTGQLAALKKDRNALARVQEHPRDKASQNASLDASFRMVGLEDTAWRTAESTGALGFMPYEAAQKYADVYGMQKAFEDQETKILEDEARFLGTLAKVDIDRGTLTAEQAGALQEVLGTWSAHLAYLELMARVSSQTDQAFLDGKDAPKSMSINMSGGK